MTKPPPSFMKVDRTHSRCEENEATLRVKTFRRGFSLGELEDIHGITVRLLREIPSIQFGAIFEYDVTICGDESRRQVVQDAIAQALQGNAGARRALVILANSLFSK